MSEPVISCIIPTFNRPHLLKQAIESTLNQTYSSWEIIIVNDGSTDATESVAIEYTKKDARIRYFKNPKKGGSSARNFGLKHAKGEFIAFLDDDDVSLPQRFESQLRAAKKANSRFVISGYKVRDRNNNKVKTEIKLELKTKGAGFPSRWMVRKDLLDKVCGFDEDFPAMQEIELSYRLAEHETYVLHDDIVTTMYHTVGSVSKIKPNAIKGKKMLMARLGHKMHPREAAWWYFIIGLDYYALNDKRKALKNMKKAAILDKYGLYRYGIYYAFLMFPFGKIFKRINQKILLFIGNYKFPIIVKHRVITFKSPSKEMKF